MKKIIVLLCILSMIVGVTACSSKTENTIPEPAITNQVTNELTPEPTEEVTPTEEVAPVTDAPTIVTPEPVVEVDPLDGLNKDEITNKVISAFNSFNDGNFYLTAGRVTEEMLLNTLTDENKPEVIFTIGKIDGYTNISLTNTFDMFVSPENVVYYFDENEQKWFKTDNDMNMSNSNSFLNIDDVKKPFSSDVELTTKTIFGNDYVALVGKNTEDQSDTYIIIDFENNEPVIKYIYSDAEEKILIQVMYEYNGIKIPEGILSVPTELADAENGDFATYFTNRMTLMTNGASIESAEIIEVTDETETFDTVSPESPEDISE